MPAMVSIPRGPPLGPLLFTELRRQGYGAEAADAALQRMATRITIVTDDEATRGLLAYVGIGAGASSGSSVAPIAYDQPLLLVDCRGMRIGDRAAMAFMEALLKASVAGPQPQLNGGQLAGPASSSAVGGDGNRLSSVGVPLSGWSLLLDSNALTDKSAAHLQTFVKRCGPLFGAPPVVLDPSSVAQQQQPFADSVGGASETAASLRLAVAALFPPSAVLLLRRLSLRGNPSLSDKSRSRLRTAERRAADALRSSGMGVSLAAAPFPIFSLDVEDAAAEAQLEVQQQQQQQTPSRLTAAALGHSQPSPFVVSEASGAGGGGASPSPAAPSSAAVHVSGTSASRVSPSRRSAASQSQSSSAVGIELLSANRRRNGGGGGTSPSPPPNNDRSDVRRPTAEGAQRGGTVPPSRSDAALGLSMNATTHPLSSGRGRSRSGEAVAVGTETSPNWAGEERVRGAVADAGTATDRASAVSPPAATPQQQRRASSRDAATSTAPLSTSAFKKTPSSPSLRDSAVSGEGDDALAVPKRSNSAASSAKDRAHRKDGGNGVEGGADDGDLTEDSAAALRRIEGLLSRPEKKGGPNVSFALEDSNSSSSSSSSSIADACQCKGDGNAYDSSTPTDADTSVNEGVGGGPWDLQDYLDITANASPAIDVIMNISGVLRRARYGDGGNRVGEELSGFGVAGSEWESRDSTVNTKDAAKGKMRKSDVSSPPMSPLLGPRSPVPRGAVTLQQFQQIILGEFAASPSSSSSSSSNSDRGSEDGDDSAENGSDDNEGAVGYAAQLARQRERQQRRGVKKQSQKGGRGSYADALRRPQSLSRQIAAVAAHNITILSISHNHLAGRLPLLPRTLRRLDVSNNYLTTLDGLAACPHLAVLNARRNRIRTLVVAPPPGHNSNAFTHNVSTSFGNVSGMLGVANSNHQHQHASVFLPSTRNAADARRRREEHKRLYATPSRAFDGTPALAHIFLGHNLLTSLDGGAVAHLVALETLDLTHNPIGVPEALLETIVRRMQRRREQKKEGGEDAKKGEDGDISKECHKDPNASPRSFATSGADKSALTGADSDDGEGGYGEEGGDVADISSLVPTGAVFAAASAVIRSLSLTPSLRHLLIAGTPFWYKYVHGGCGPTAAAAAHPDHSTGSAIDRSNIGAAVSRTASGIPSSSSAVVVLADHSLASHHDDEKKKKRRTSEREVEAGLKRLTAVVRNLCPALMALDNRRLPQSKAAEAARAAQEALMGRGLNTRAFEGFSWERQLAGVAEEAFPSAVAIGGGDIHYDSHRYSNASHTSANISSYAVMDEHRRQFRLSAAAANMYHLRRSDGTDANAKGHFVFSGAAQPFSGASSAAAGYAIPSKVHQQALNISAAQQLNRLSASAAAGDLSFGAAAAAAAVNAVSVAGVVVAADGSRVLATGSAPPNTALDPASYSLASASAAAATDYQRRLREAARHQPDYGGAAGGGIVPPHTRSSAIVVRTFDASANSSGRIGNARGGLRSKAVAAAHNSSAVSASMVVAGRSADTAKGVRAVAAPVTFSLNPLGNVHPPSRSDEATAAMVRGTKGLAGRYKANHLIAANIGSIKNSGADGLNSSRLPTAAGNRSVGASALNDYGNKPLSMRRSSSAAGDRSYSGKSSRGEGEVGQLRHRRANSSASYADRAAANASAFNNTINSSRINSIYASRTTAANNSSLALAAANTSAAVASYPNPTAAAAAAAASAVRTAPHRATAATAAASLTAQRAGLVAAVALSTEAFVEEQLAARRRQRALAAAEEAEVRRAYEEWAAEEERLEAEAAALAALAEERSRFEASEDFSRTLFNTHEAKKRTAIAEAESIALEKAKEAEAQRAAERAERRRKVIAEALARQEEEEATAAALAAVERARSEAAQRRSAKARADELEERRLRQQLIDETEAARAERGKILSENEAARAQLAALEALRERHEAAAAAQQHSLRVELQKAQEEQLAALEALEAERVRREREVAAEAEVEAALRAQRRRAETARAVDGEEEVGAARQRQSQSQRLSSSVSRGGAPIGGSTSTATFAKHLAVVGSNNNAAASLEEVAALASPSLQHPDITGEADFTTRSSAEGGQPPRLVPITDVNNNGATTVVSASATTTIGGAAAVAGATAGTSHFHNLTVASSGLTPATLVIGSMAAGDTAAAQFAALAAAAVAMSPPTSDPLSMSMPAREGSSQRRHDGLLLMSPAPNDKGDGEEAAVDGGNSSSRAKSRPPLSPPLLEADGAATPARGGRVTLFPSSAALESAVGDGSPLAIGLLSPHSKASSGGGTARYGGSNAGPPPITSRIAAAATDSAASTNTNATAPLNSATVAPLSGAALRLPASPLYFGTSTEAAVSPVKEDGDNNAPPVEADGNPLHCASGTPLPPLPSPAAPTSPPPAEREGGEGSSSAAVAALRVGDSPSNAKSAAPSKGLSRKHSDVLDSFAGLIARTDGRAPSSGATSVSVKPQPQSVANKSDGAAATPPAAIQAVASGNAQVTRILSPVDAASSNDGDAVAAAAELQHQRRRSILKGGSIAARLVSPEEAMTTSSTVVNGKSGSEKGIAAASSGAAIVVVPPSIVTAPSASAPNSPTPPDSRSPSPRGRPARTTSRTHTTTGSTVLNTATSATHHVGTRSTSNANKKNEKRPSKEKANSNEKVPSSTVVVADQQQSGNRRRPHRPQSASDSNADSRASGSAEGGEEEAASGDAVTSGSDSNNEEPLKPHSSANPNPNIGVGGVGNDRSTEATELDFADRLELDDTLDAPSALRLAVAMGLAPASAVAAVAAAAEESHQASGAGVKQQQRGNNNSRHSPSSADGGQPDSPSSFNGRQRSAAAAAASTTTRQRTGAALGVTASNGGVGERRGSASLRSYPQTDDDFSPNSHTRRRHPHHNQQQQSMGGKHRGEIDDDDSDGESNEGRGGRRRAVASQSNSKGGEARSTAGSKSRNSAANAGPATATGLNTTTTVLSHNATPFDVVVLPDGTKRLQYRQPSLGSVLAVERAAAKLRSRNNRGEADGADEDDDGERGNENEAKYYSSAASHTNSRESSLASASAASENQKRRSGGQAASNQHGKSSSKRNREQTRRAGLTPPPASPNRRASATDSFGDGRGTEATILVYPTMDASALNGSIASAAAAAQRGGGASLRQQQQHSSNPHQRGKRGGGGGGDDEAEQPQSSSSPTTPALAVMPPLHPSTRRQPSPPVSGERVIHYGISTTSAASSSPAGSPKKRRGGSPTPNGDEQPSQTQRVSAAAERREESPPSHASEEQRLQSNKEKRKKSGSALLAPSMDESDDDDGDALAAASAAMVAAVPRGAPRLNPSALQQPATAADVAIATRAAVKKPPPPPMDGSDFGGGGGGDSTPALLFAPVAAAQEPDVVRAGGVGLARGPGGGGAASKTKATARSGSRRGPMLPPAFDGSSATAATSHVEGDNADAFSSSVFVIGASNPHSKQQSLGAAASSAPYGTTAMEGAGDKTATRTSETSPCPTDPSSVGQAPAVILPHREPLRRTRALPPPTPTSDGGGSTGTLPYGGGPPHHGPASSVTVAPHEQASASTALRRLSASFSAAAASSSASASVDSEDANEYLATVGPADPLRLQRLCPQAREWLAALRVDADAVGAALRAVEEIVDIQQSLVAEYCSLRDGGYPSSPSASDASSLAAMSSDDLLDAHYTLIDVATKVALSQRLEEEEGLRRRQDGGQKSSPMEALAARYAATLSERAACLDLLATADRPKGRHHHGGGSSANSGNGGLQLLLPYGQHCSPNAIAARTAELRLADLMAEWRRAPVPLRLAAPGEDEVCEDEDGSSSPSSPYHAHRHSAKRSAAAAPSPPQQPSERAVRRALRQQLREDCAADVGTWLREEFGVVWDDAAEDYRPSTPTDATSLTVGGDAQSSAQSSSLMAAVVDARRRTVLTPLLAAVRSGKARLRYLCAAAAQEREELLLQASLQTGVDGTEDAETFAAITFA